VASRGSGIGLLIDVVAAAQDRAAARGLAAWLAHTAPRRARGTVTVAVVSDARMRRLNRAFRRVDRATDVLSFPAAAPARAPKALGDEPAGRRDSDPALGDIVIARGVAARQARRAGHTLSAEVRVLALHGLLHLLGYDHERDTGQMARLEGRLRRRGGLPAGLIARTGRGPWRPRERVAR
jgi:probable rRNA maturation factor